MGHNTAGALTTGNRNTALGNFCMAGNTTTGDEKLQLVIMLLENLQLELETLQLVLMHCMVQWFLQEVIMLLLVINHQEL